VDKDLIKVMVVDDEEIPRKFIKMCINWSSLGMEFVGEASSGVEALDLIDELNPDVVFTDIQMPFMNGLELSNSIIERFPYIKIVIVTAHREFEYARKSINLGAADFLLKPINKAEVMKVAKSLKGKIQDERVHWSEFYELKKQLQDNFVYLKEKFLNELLHNSSIMEELEKKFLYFYPGSKMNFFQICLIEPSHYELPKEIGQEKRLILGLRCIEIIKQYFKENSNIDVFFDNSHKIVIINKDSVIDMPKCCGQIKSMIIGMLKSFVSIGIGSVYEHLSEISRSYKEALDALRYCVVSGRNQVVFFSEDISFSRQKWNLRTDEIGQIGFFVKAGIDDKALEYIQRIFDEFAVSRKVTIEQVRVISINIISVVLNAIADMGLNYEETSKASVMSYNRIFEMDTFKDISEYLKGFVLSNINSIRGIRSKKSKKIIDDVKGYIQNNLASPEMSLSTVSHDFYINSSYLSRIFKKETGESFTEYLLKIRIEKAIEFLNTTDMKAYQIAEAIGIKDPYYFSNCFKKFTGLCVNEYKNTKYKL
jgi:two-component system, response regulator YesN